jgi:hypothetical protein
MMDEMAKTLARRRKAVEKKEQPDAEQVHSALIVNWCLVSFLNLFFHHPIFVQSAKDSQTPLPSL